jgi:LuxR family maltose regulon positive regulatory protein
MPISLLATKFYIPPLRTHAVARPFLGDKLSLGISQPGKFILLSGPAGFGKTTLLSEFVTQQQNPVAWMSLDDADNDPIYFWTYLIAALQKVQNGVGEIALANLSLPQNLPPEAIPSILINDLDRLGGEIILVLDDYHVIKNEAIHEGLLFLLEHMPQNLHPVISTRIDPPWPLARFRARNQIVEIRTQDLRFS